MVKVIAPDGSTELWAVACAPEAAVGIVQSLIPEGHIAKKSSQHLPVSKRMEGFRFGEARKVRP